MNWCCHRYGTTVPIWLLIWLFIARHCPFEMVLHYKLKDTHWVYHTSSVTQVQIWTVQWSVVRALALLHSMISINMLCCRDGSLLSREAESRSMTWRFINCIDGDETSNGGCEVRLINRFLRGWHWHNRRRDPMPDTLREWKTEAI